jgi:Ras-related protein Rab-18
MGSSSALSSGSYDLSFKILLIGDSNVGKTSLIVSFVSDSTEPPLPTVGTFFFISSRVMIPGGRLTVPQEPFILKKIIFKSKNCL